MLNNILSAAFMVVLWPLVCVAAAVMWVFFTMLCAVCMIVAWPILVILTGIGDFDCQ